MRLQSATPDQRCAQIATRQHGVLSFEQLLAAGLTQAAIQRRLRAARLHRVYRGVYAVGHAALSNEGRWLAAVLACGEGAVLSHRSAAELWRMLPATLGPIDVTVPGIGGRAKRQGLRIQRSSSLLSADTTRRDGIAVTTSARTIADLRDRRLVVETNGWQGRRGRQAFEDDRERDVYLHARGFEVVRITWRQLEDNPGSVLAVLRRYLRCAVP